MSEDDYYIPLDMRCLSECLAEHGYDFDSLEYCHERCSKDE